MDWTKQGSSMADTYHEFLVPAIFAPCAELVVDAAEIGSGARVVDVACGTGVVSRTASRRAGPEGAVVAVDMAPPMLGVARREGTPDGGAPITYLEGDAQSLPVDDGGFDAVLCQHGLQFFPDRAAAVAEMVRVLRPGGVVAVACWSRFDQAPTFRLIQRALAEHVGEEPAAMMRMPFSVSPEELGSLLGEAGLEDVSVTDREITARFGAPPEDIARRALEAGPLAPIYAGAPDHVRTAIEAQVAEDVRPYADGASVVAPVWTSVARGRKGTAAA